MATILDQILRHKKAEVLRLKKTAPLARVKAMMADAPPVRDFKAALDSGFGLIAEIKRKSPSMGLMRAANFNAAVAAYEASPVVRAISVLTDAKYFGMSIARLRRIKLKTRKPVLRKDFIFDEYQVYEARAYGADAILLMACLLERSKMANLFELASELGMHVLFESHTAAEIDAIPRGAAIYGINSRNFMSRDKGVITQFERAKSAAFLPGKTRDLSTDLSTFDLVKRLPGRAIKVAESGVQPENIAEVRARGFDTVLVGTALMRAGHGVRRELERFEEAILSGRSGLDVSQPSLASA